MIFRKKNDKLNFDTLIGIRDDVDLRETMVVQVSFAIDLATGSAHSFINILSRELYLKNKEDILAEIEKIKEEYEEKAKSYGVEIIS